MSKEFDIDKELNTPFVETEYSRGFNEGYLVSKHLPDIAESLAKAFPMSDRKEGFENGRKQYLLDEKEIAIQQALFKEWSEDYKLAKEDRLDTPKSIEDNEIDLDKD